MCELCVTQQLHIWKSAPLRGESGGSGDPLLIREQAGGLSHQSRTHWAPCAVEPAPPGPPAPACAHMPSPTCLFLLQNPRTAFGKAPCHLCSPPAFPFSPWHGLPFILAPLCSFHSPLQPQLLVICGSGPRIRLILQAHSPLRCCWTSILTLGHHQIAITASPPASP